MFWKRLCRSSLDLLIEVFVPLTVNAIMYESGKPLVKKWKVIILGECIIGKFITSMRVFMKFVEYSFKHSEREAYAYGRMYKI